jgi:hypothetical protein
VLLQRLRERAPGVARGRAGGTSEQERVGGAPLAVDRELLSKALLGLHLLLCADRQLGECVEHAAGSTGTAGRCGTALAAEVARYRSKRSERRPARFAGGHSPGRQPGVIWLWRHLLQESAPRPPRPNWLQESRAARSRHTHLCLFGGRLSHAGILRPAPRCLLSSRPATARAVRAFGAAARLCRPPRAGSRTPSLCWRLPRAALVHSPRLGRSCGPARLCCNSAQTCLGTVALGVVVRPQVSVGAKGVWVPLTAGAHFSPAAARPCRRAMGPQRGDATRGPLRRSSVAGDTLRALRRRTAPAGRRSARSRGDLQPAAVGVFGRRHHVQACAFGGHGQRKPCLSPRRPVVGTARSG